MDSGEEISGLDQGWTFLGAKIPEWVSGIAVFLLVGEIFFKGSLDSGIPIMFICMVLTTMGMTRIRKMYPDEERGVRNDVMVKMGFPPPGIPSPSYFQPHWSGAPLEKLSPDCDFIKLGFDKIFFGDDTNLEEAEIPQHILVQLNKDKKKGNPVNKDNQVAENNLENSFSANS